MKVCKKDVQNRDFSSSIINYDTPYDWIKDESFQKKELRERKHLLYAMRNMHSILEPYYEKSDLRKVV